MAQERKEAANALGESIPRNVPRFVHHVLDKDLQAMGADIGDRDPNGQVEIIACDDKGVYRYAKGVKTLIDKLEGPALLIHLRTSDMDGDGDWDVVVADHRNGISYYENPGNEVAKGKRWPKHIIDDRTKGAHAVAVADLDRDGRPDVIASGESNATPPDTIFWFACPKDPNGAERWVRHALGPGQSGGLAHYPSVGDVNKDGRLDVVHAAKNGQPDLTARPPLKMGEWYRLWRQPVDPTAPWEFEEVGARYTQATNIQVGDVNGDEIPDLIATQGHHVGVLWFEGPNWKPHYIDQTLRSPHTLVVADLDRDGDLDVATCAYESKVMAWFANDGLGRFVRHTISEDQAAYDLVARDVDGDGDLDFVVAGQNSRTVSWYEQTGRPETIRVMTYNIHHGEGTDGKVDLHRIASLIRRERMDIVALQEVDRRVARTQGRDLAAELSALTGMEVQFAKNIDHQGGEYGTALLSRFPFVSHSHTHYRMWLSREQRGLQQAVLNVGGKRLVILNTHLDFSRDDRERLEHIDEIGKVSAAHGKAMVLVLGDFNDVPTSPSYLKMKAKFIDVWEAGGEGDGFTVPSGEPRKRIDYIFASGPVRINKAWVPRTEASDHLPVGAEIHLGD